MNETVFAYRTLEKPDKSTAQARLYLPRQDGDDWYCRVQIEEETDSRAYGVDPLQALCLGAKMLAAELRDLETTNPGTYRHDGNFSLADGLPE